MSEEDNELDEDLDEDLDGSGEDGFEQEANYEESDGY